MISPALHSFAYALDYLREQVADVPAERLSEQPPGVPNHAAWTIGHLAYTCEVFGALFDMPPRLGDEWRRRYWTGSVPMDDAGAYHTKQELLTALAEGQTQLIRAIEACDPARFDEPFPDPEYREIFPTIRHAVVQVLIGHTSYHVGQLSAWRRAMKLPKMPRAFD